MLVVRNRVGDLNQVVMEFTAESREEIEMQETIGSPLYRERMAGYTELWLTGSREIFRIV